MGEEYLENKILKNNNDSTQSLPYKQRIENISQKLGDIQITWDAYYLHNKDFRRFIKKCNLYNSLKYKLENEYHINHATNNWLNMYEILFRFQHIFDGSTILTLFNTDMPGEIILATEHFLKNRVNLHKWMALQNSNESIDDDKYRVYQTNVHKWVTTDKCFDEVCDSSHMTETQTDTSSEIMNIKKSQYVYNKINKVNERMKRKCDLFISHTFINEDNVISDYIQYILALSTIIKGGNMIIRSFHIHSPFKIWIICTVSKYFDNLYVVKPVSSPGYHTDVFVVGQHFNGITKNDLDKLYYILSSFKRRHIYKIPTRVNIDTVQSLYKFIFRRSKLEIETKNRLIEMFKKYHGCRNFYKTLELESENITKKYISKFGIELF